MLNLAEHESDPAINVKMSTFVDILTSMSRINTTSVSFKARKIYIFWLFFHFGYLFIFRKIYINDNRATGKTWPSGYKAFSTLNSTEHEIYPAYKG